WLKTATSARALATAYARVAKGRHWLSDVVAGLWLGGAIGWRTMRHPRWWLECGRKSCAVFAFTSF
ncbi:MAG: phosphatase PAP2 family protein, partial [Zetaproteobacteria bacterium]